MATRLTWFGHATWLIESDQHRLLLDPFFDDNPASPVKAETMEVDTILVSHGHFDHIADAASIASRNGAKVITNYEIAQWLNSQHGLADVAGMNLGGKLELPWGVVKMVPALHSSGLPDGSYGGEPAGFVFSIAGNNIYFACDTAVFGDMKLIGEQGIDLAVLPIGDLYTMGPEDSVKATNLLHAKSVLPTHFNTWPPIEQNTEAWCGMIRESTQATPFVLEPGQTHTL